VQERLVPSPHGSVTTERVGLGVGDGVKPVAGDVGGVSVGGPPMVVGVGSIVFVGVRVFVALGVEVARGVGVGGTSAR
jgi:hypothetical protein